MSFRKSFVTIVLIGVAEIVALGGKDAGAAPITVQADVLIPGAPAAVDEFSPLTLSVDFGIQFLSIDTITFTSTFSGDLWDSGESYTIFSPVALNLGGFGQTNVLGFSRSEATLTVNPSSGPPNSLWGAELLDGRLDNFRFMAGTGTTISLSTLRIEITGVVPTTVVIDIKPGSDPNSINPVSNGVIPVAILTTDTFDATQVDPLTVAFGPIGASESHGRSHIKDVDGDGDMDLVLHFNTQDTGIQCGDTDASLTGETFGGEPIAGIDSIRTVPCP